MYQTKRTFYVQYFIFPKIVPSLR